MGDVVVLLPGITGSVLQRNGKDVWAPTPHAIVGGLWSLGRSLNELELRADPVDDDDSGDGVVATRLVPDVHVIPHFWCIDGYSAITATIRGTFDVVPGRTFLEFPYDWRRDNRVSARRLAAVALPALHEQRKANPNAKLVLIGHSMGGLVARYFLECLDGWKDTRLLITFGTPYRGSLNALNFLANGFRKKVGPFSVADLSKLMRSFTSLYQLLPIYPCIDGGDGILTRVAETPGLPPIIDKKKANAAEQQFHRAIESAVAKRERAEMAEPYIVHPIVGLSQPTFQSAQLGNGRLTMLRTYEGDDLDGDGTVPRVSATPIEFDGLKADRGIYAPDRHAALQNSVSIRTQLLGLLNPVARPERFKDARGGLRLELDDLYSLDEEIAVTVVSGTRRDTLVATVSDVATARPLIGPMPLRAHDDETTHTLELGPLPAGCYRLEVVPAGGSIPGPRHSRSRRVGLHFSWSAAV